MQLKNYKLIVFIGLFFSFNNNNRKCVHTAFSNKQLTMFLIALADNNWLISRVMGLKILRTKLLSLNLTFSI